MEKIFGIGWSKTGTTSLAAALGLLGFTPRTSYNHELVLAVRDGDMDRVFKESDRYRVFDDWPWPLVFREMNERYPDARFILTVRKPEDRFVSFRKHVGRQMPQKEEVMQAREFCFGKRDPENHKDEMTHRYVAHNNDVIDYFAARPGKLLVVSWDSGHGWQELCEFLSVPIPDEPFPHANKAPND